MLRVYGVGIQAMGLRDFSEGLCTWQLSCQDSVGYWPKRNPPAKGWLLALHCVKTTRSEPTSSDATEPGYNFLHTLHEKRALSFRHSRKDIRTV